MHLEDSVSQWIDGLRDGNDEAAERLWHRYFESLKRYARLRLPAHVKRGFDEEDVALSAFHSVCAGFEAGRFPELTDRDGLWSLLVVITARKARYRLRHATARKRGGGRVRGESALDTPSGVGGLLEIIGEEPSPEFAAEMAEEFERMLSVLEDETLCRIAVLKMEGYSNEEIASLVGTSLRTVERRLGLIRRIWIQCSDAGNEGVQSQR